MHCWDCGHETCNCRKVTPIVGTRERITAECEKVKQLLLAKNAAYGNSASEPLRLFSKADPEEGIRIRIDDKLSRIARGSDDGEDTEMDLIGYLILLRVVRAAR